MSRCIHSEILDFPARTVAGRSVRVKPMSPEIAQLWQTLTREGFLGRLAETGAVLDGDALGLMSDFTEDAMTYTVGLFIKDDAKLPAEFDIVQLRPCTVLRTWVEGPAEKIYGETHPISVRIAQELGYKEDWEQAFCAEVYTEARFMKSMNETPETLILDYLLPVVKR